MTDSNEPAREPGATSPLAPPPRTLRGRSRSRLQVSSLVVPAHVVSRRRFLALAGGLTLAGCSGNLRSTDGDDADGPPVADAAAPSTSTPGSTPTTVPGSVTATSVPDGAIAGDRVLVVVSLDGGNDAVNTLPPDLGSYRDVRPGLALDESAILRHADLAGHGLHPALEPLLPHLDTGELAVVAGVGFPDPDRSHFTSIDRWDRADRMEEGYGWLGRWLDTLPTELPTLGATALGGSGQMLAGASTDASVIGDVDAFAFPDAVSNADIRALAASATDDDPLRAAARAAFATSVGAVEEFDAIADAVRGSGDRERRNPYGNGSGPFANGLAVASELIRGDVGTRVVTVRANGFDTHSNQLGQHETLLADLAAGLAEFWAGLAASGDDERVLLVTTSEFGRRVTENGSAGCDHGSAGLSLVMGPRVRGGLHGAIDTDVLQDGDLVPRIDPRTIYTAAIDWLGGDAETVLGGRWDEVPLVS